MLFTFSSPCIATLTFSLCTATFFSILQYVAPLQYEKWKPSKRNKQNKRKPKMKEKKKKKKNKREARQTQWKKKQKKNKKTHAAAHASHLTPHAATDSCSTPKRETATPTLPPSPRPRETHLDSCCRLLDLPSPTSLLQLNSQVFNLSFPSFLQNLI